MRSSRVICSGILAVFLLLAVPAHAQQVCAAAWEWLNGANASITLSCPNGGIVYWIDFASYGTPDPVPYGYDPNDYITTSEQNPTLAPVCASLAAIAVGECHAASSGEIVEAACLGESSCSVLASNDVFGDPCENTFKRLYAVATCGPATADQCKRGGWRSYGFFTSQGDCVSFVRTGGKNPPAAR